MEGRQEDGFVRKAPLIELKARLLCEGARADRTAKELFRLQNPSNVKRGGLSSGGKVRLEGGPFVNFPFYEKRETRLTVVKDPGSDFRILVQECGETLAGAEILLPGMVQRKGGWLGHNPHIHRPQPPACNFGL